jgi:hypothetical protein
MGEVMQRIGQPAVMGQLIAGIVLGPSALGALWPAGQQALFPVGPDQKAMLDAVAQLGILLLLLLTGMETDLSVVRRSRRAAFSISIFGIALPFLCGFLLGELLPDTMLPDPGKRLITTLFLGVALSISSVKIVAMVVREVGFLRRTIGQVIVAAAIIDDTIGWIIMSVVFGLASHRAIDVWSLGQSLAGIALFLGASFTVGRQIVFRLIRFANDRFVSELPVITTILVITGLMALTTNEIGVHTVLGAFIAGILIGQSPILSGPLHAGFFRACRIDHEPRGPCQHRSAASDDRPDRDCKPGQVRRGVSRRPPRRDVVGRVDCAWLWHERTRFDRSHRCHHLVDDGGAESGPLYNHCRDGGGDDDVDAPLATLGARPAADHRGGGRTAQARGV